VTFNAVRMRLLAPLAVVVLALSACLPARVRRDYVVSSVTSEYSPVVNLAVRVRVDDSIRVTVDSGRLLAPGYASRRRSPLMRDIVLEALVAERSPDGMREPGVPGTWRTVATSEPQSIADSVFVGEPVPVRPLRFVLPLSPAVSARRAWLVFRVRGNAIGTPVTMADGTQVPAQLMADGVRVHACAVRTLTGHLDRRRARRLAKDYLATC
jgi:hypothetical protein